MDQFRNVPLQKEKNYIYEDSPTYFYNIFILYSYTDWVYPQAFNTWHSIHAYGLTLRVNCAIFFNVQLILATYLKSAKKKSTFLE